MEDVLTVYTRPYDPLYPSVCFDESNKQLVAEKIEPKPVEPGHRERHDYQDERNGVSNLFMFFEALAAWRHVEVTDSDYSAKTFLAEQEQHPNLVVVTRVRSNRVFYASPEPKIIPSVGHPRWYGAKFDSLDEATWPEPTEVVQTNCTTKRGRLLQVRIQSWSDMLMRGSHDSPMHRNPFTLMQIQITTPEGISLWKPMWLIIMGQRRHELTTIEGYQAYRQRYDLEHLLRFGKQRLLLNASITPEVEHEENWVSLSFLAYVQLWAARKLASSLPRRWERYLPNKSEDFLSPSLVQRDLNRIITEIGTPANSPKPRGFSSGRTEGMIQTKRTRHEVIKKGKKGKKRKKGKKGKKGKKLEPSPPIAV